MQKRRVISAIIFLAVLALSFQNCNQFEALQPTSKFEKSLSSVGPVEAIAPPTKACWAPRPKPLSASNPSYAVNGAGRRKVLVSSTASPVVREAAQKLANILKEMTGFEFPIEDSTPNQLGIFVGTAADYTIPGIDVSLPANSETHYLVSTHQTMYLIGATDDGVGHAVWSFLQYLGYRRYFPGSDWRIVPKRTDSMSYQINYVCTPAFEMRKFFYGFGTLPHRVTEFTEWAAENRFGGKSVPVGHSYDTIIKENKAFFDAHPEVLARRPDGTPSTKFCVTNRLLQEVVINYAKNYFSKNPGATYISIEPSDGLNWDGCNEDPAQLPDPSISNRAVYLANLVASAINKDSPVPRFVTMYAYGGHSNPPTIRLHSNVVVFGATAFSDFQDGTYVDQLNLWRKQGQRSGGALMGARDYWSFTTWDRDLAGGTAASDLQNLQTELYEYSKAGVLYYMSEASDNWGPNGLSYWTAASMLMEPLANTPADYLNDFVNNAFGSAAAPMKKFYEFLHGSVRPLQIPSFYGELYRLLDAALRLRPGPDAEKRIRTLVLYVHYHELYKTYISKTAPGVPTAEGQAAFENLIKYVLAIRNSGMVHTYGMWRDLDARDFVRDLPPEVTYWADRTRNPWLQTEITHQSTEVNSLLSTGVRLPAYVVPAPIDERNLRSRSGFAAAPPEIDALALTGMRSMTFRTKQTLLYHAQTRNEILNLKLYGGIVHAGKIDIKICPQAASAACAFKESVEANKTFIPLTFVAKDPGVYLIEVDDRSHGVRLYWNDSAKISVVASYTNRPNLFARWTNYFYVPANIQKFRIYSSSWNNIFVCPHPCTPENLMQVESSSSGLAEITVPPGQSGKPWQMRGFGTVILYDVIPTLASSPDQLLIPYGVN